MKIAQEALGDDISQAKLVLELPNKYCQKISLFIFSFIIIAFDILLVIINLIVQSATLKQQEENKKFILPNSLIQMHLTWGIPLQFSLYFIEDSINWIYLRKTCNIYTSLLIVLMIIFFLVAIYTWLWANDNAGINLICKYFLSIFNLQISIDQMRERAYNEDIQNVLNYLLVFLLPVQCILIFIDLIIKICIKQKQRKVLINTKVDRGIILVKLAGVDIQ